MEQKHHTKTAIAFACIFAGIFLLVATGTYTSYYYSSVRHHMPQVESLQATNGIQDWMSIFYVARASGVPQRVLLGSVNLTATQVQYKSISALAHMQHESTGSLIMKLSRAIHLYKQTH